MTRKLQFNILVNKPLTGHLSPGSRLETFCWHLLVRSRRCQHQNLYTYWCLQNINANDNSRALFQKCYITSTLNGTEDDRHCVEKQEQRHLWIEKLFRRVKYEDSWGVSSPIYFAYIFIFMYTEKIYDFLEACFKKENKQPITSETDLTFTTRSQNYYKPV